MLVQAALERDQHQNRKHGHDDRAPVIRLMSFHLAPGAGQIPLNSVVEMSRN